MSGKRSGEDKPSSTDCADDIRLLLDCLHYNHGNYRHGSPQRQALTTIAAMCTNDSGARDQVRKCGVLVYILEMVYSEPDPLTLQTALMALGCAAERNVVNQSKLCEEKLFTQLSSIFMSHDNQHDNQLTLLHSTAYLLGCLMTGNGRGQNMARESNTITALINIFKSLLPSSNDDSDNDDDDSVKVWRSVVSALCTATNNPQNEPNQMLCSTVFPAAISLLSLPHHNTTLQPTLTLITSCVDNNASVQSRFSMVGGLQCLVNGLYSLTTKKREEEKGELCHHLVQCISACSFGHSSNCGMVCSLDCVPLIVSLLHTPSISLTSLIALILCLGTLTENNVSAQRQVIECGGLPLLVTYMAEYQNDEVSKAATFVLQCCLQDDHCQQQHSTLPTTVHSTSNTTCTNIPQSSSDTMPCLTPSTLKTLNDRKTPLETQVHSWLQSSPPLLPTSTTIPHDGAWLPRLQLLQQLVEGMDPSSVRITRQSLDQRNYIEVQKSRIEDQSQNEIKHSGIETERNQSGNETEIKESGNATEVRETGNETKVNESWNETIVKKSGNDQSGTETEVKQSGDANKYENETEYDGLRLVQADSTHIHTNKTTATTLSLQSLTQPLMLQSNTPPHPTSIHIPIPSHNSCMACRPRINGPLITSRTFLKVIMNDCYTCDYHQSLTSRVMTGYHDDSRVVSGVIDGSREILIDYDHTDTPGDRTNIITDHTNTITDHTNTITDHTDSITDHTDTITDHTNTIADHTNTYTDTSDMTYDPSTAPDSSMDTSQDQEEHCQENQLLSSTKTLTIRPNSILATLQHSPSINSTAPTTTHTTQLQEHHNNSRDGGDRRYVKNSYKTVSHTRRYEMSHWNKKRCVERQPLSDRSNIPHNGVARSEFDYSTPANEKKASRQVVKKVPRNSCVVEARKAIPFTKEEVTQLMRSVHELGPRWKHILTAYTFHPSRTPCSLKDKYRNLTQRR